MRGTHLASVSARRSTSPSQLEYSRSKNGMKISSAEVDAAPRFVEASDAGAFAMDDARYSPRAT